MNSPLPARAWPRGLTLLALTLAVLGTHLVLLTGAWPSGSPNTPAASLPSRSKPGAMLARPIAPDAAPPRPAAVLTSQVRWIAPPAARPPMLGQPEPTLAQAAPPPPTPRLPPASKARAPEATSIAAAANPEPAPEAATPNIESPASTFEDPPNAPIEVRDPAPQAASEAPQTAAIETVATETPAPQDGTSLSTGGTNPPPEPAQPPASAQLRYSVEGQSKGLTYSATGSLDWRNEGSAYSASLEIRVFLLGSRTQTSQGQLSATGLQPERFADKSRSERAAHFDRAKNRIRFSNNTPDAELLPGAQDRLSVFLQLAGLLNARPEAYTSGQSIDIPVAGTSGSETWRFQVQELASLDLPAGSLIARHLVREPREPRDTRVDIWLAPSLGHLPVRIRLTQDNGDVVDQRLSALP